MLFKVFIGVVILWVILFIISKVKSLHEPYFNWLKKQKPVVRRRMVWVARIVAFTPVITLVILTFVEFTTFVITKKQSLESIPEAYSFGLAAGIIFGMVFSSALVLAAWTLSRASQERSDKRRDKARRLRMMEVKR